MTHYPTRKFMIDQHRPEAINARLLPRAEIDRIGQELQAASKAIDPLKITAYVDKLLKQFRVGKHQSYDPEVFMTSMTACFSRFPEHIIKQFVTDYPRTCAFIPSVADAEKHMNLKLNTIYRHMKNLRDMRQKIEDRKAEQENREARKLKQSSGGEDLLTRLRREAVERDAMKAEG